NIDVHAEYRSGNEQGMRHVVSAIAHKCHCFTMVSAKVLLYCQEISEHLRRMPVVGQCIPDRDTGMFSERFNRLLFKAPESNAVKHRAQYFCRILHGLLGSELELMLIEIFDSSPKLSSCDSESRSRPCGLFFKNKCNLFPAHETLGNAVFLFSFKMFCEVDQCLELFFIKVMLL